jgi:diguanylate cyclase (GGDEF)-like protein
MLPLKMPLNWEAPEARRLPPAPAGCAPAHFGKTPGRAADAALLAAPGHVGLACFDSREALVDVNLALCSAFGRTRQQLAGSRFDALFAVQEVLMQSAASPPAPLLLEWSAVRLLGAADAGPTHMVTVLEERDDGSGHGTSVMVGDLGAAIGIPQTIDHLTGALTAAAFATELERAIQRHRDGSGFVLVLLGVNRLQTLVALFGHAACDQVIAGIAERLRTLAGWHGLIGRLRDDEFAVLLTPGPDEDLGGIAQQHLAAVSLPFQIDGEEVQVTAAAGVSCFPEHGRSAETLSRAAETALNHARSRPLPAAQVFDAELGWAIRRKAELERSLRKALQRGEFHIEYQPRVELHSMRLVAMEALLRWNHPQLGRIPPLDFIGLAEEQGMIADIGRWVLHAACAFARELADELATPLRVSVNISAQQLKGDRIIDDIRSALHSTQLAPCLLEIELTESLLVDDHERCAALFRRLKELGIALSVDDFGTGYSSLAYLQAFPVDAIKLDKSFVNRDGGSARNLRLLKALVDLAHALELEVVAEGVEDADVLHFLRASRCNEVQGYLVSKPLGPEGFRQFLQSYIPGFDWSSQPAA